jgi:NDP-sugar pyrophosphorylase family protein
LNKLVRTKELYRQVPDYLAPLFNSCEYPWEMLPKIKSFIFELIEKGITGYRPVSYDVLVGENVNIYPTATVEGPAIIGSGSVIRPGAFLRGSVIIGSGCVIGNSSELKNCILLDKVQVPHYNYIGDSVLGYKAHTGAGTICSNLKTDGRDVVIHGDVDYATGLRKLGAILGDNADVGCNCVLNPGTVIGISTSVYPMTRLRGVYPECCIVKSEGLFVAKEER